MVNIDPLGPSEAIRIGNMKLIYGKAEAGHYSGWIKPNEYVDEANTIAKSTDQNDVEWTEEVAPEYMFRAAKMDAIFQELGRTPLLPHPAIVQYGEKPKNASTNCDVKKSPSFYDISKDPCEYNNLANEFPSVVKMLQSKLNEYRKTMQKPRIKPDDPASNPKYFGGVWTPWVNLTDIKHSEL